MSILSRLTHCALAAFLTFGVLSATSQVVAQTSSPTRTSSVLPTGGGAALLDASDTVILLLDHQTGLFQTVKDISVAELRANTIMPSSGMGPVPMSPFSDWKNTFTSPGI